MSASIIFDFDGTLTTGNGPVLAYARMLAADAPGGFLESVEQALAAFDNGDQTFRDGYDAVGSLARAGGVAETRLSAAYLASREQLGTAQAPVETMAGLSDFLQLLATRARIILATNAPETGIDAVLRSWGVRDLFTERHYHVGKPTGLMPVVSAAVARGPVLAIGDIVEFDLAPALQLGGDTVLVGATAAHSPAPVTMRGKDLAALRTDIETWSAQAESSIAAHNHAAKPLER